MSNRRNLSQNADEIVDFIDKNPTDTARKSSGGHDVSNEPRVPKGSEGGGRWTSGGRSSAPSDEELSKHCPNGYEIVPMEVTAYTSGVESTGKGPGDRDYGRTAGKAKAGPGTIAAPPHVDFGTRMYVPGYGWGTVEDRGIAIQGNHLDVWFEKVGDARKWGRQKVNVIVCKMK